MAKEKSAGQRSGFSALRSGAENPLSGRSERLWFLCEGVAEKSEPEARREKRNGESRCLFSLHCGSGAENTGNRQRRARREGTKKQPADADCFFMPVASSNIEIQMVLYRCLNLLLLDADIALGDGSAAVLQELLDQGNIVAVCLVDLRCEELPEAVGADAGIP